MKYYIGYKIKLRSIEDDVVFALEKLLKSMGLILDFDSLIIQKYTHKEILDMRNTSLEKYLLGYEYNYEHEIDDEDINSAYHILNIEYKSLKHKKILEFIKNNKMEIVRNFDYYEDVYNKYSNDDFKRAKYFNLYFHEYCTHMSQKLDEINRLKLKPSILTDNFIIFDNEENFICNKDMTKKVKFQMYQLMYNSIYFISKELGEFLVENKFTGFSLKPVNKVKTHEIVFYQLKVTNIIEQPSIETETKLLNREEDYIWPKSDSEYYKFFKKSRDTEIYEKDYMQNNFCDFNMKYFSVKYPIYEEKICVDFELIVSERVMLLFNANGSKFYKNPVYSDEDVSPDIFKLEDEIKAIIKNNKN